MEGCAHLGVLHSKGAGVTQDVVRATALLEQACEGRQMMACAELGSIYASAKDHDGLLRAATLLRKSCDAWRPRSERTRAAGISRAASSLATSMPPDLACTK